MSFLFLVCYKSDTVRYKAASVPFQIYDTKWYQAPIEHQKFVQMMIIFGQKEQRFSGGGMLTCDLEIFVRVRLWKWLS